MDDLILNSLDIHKFELHEHFLEVLPLIEEAIQRLGSPTSANTWLLTPATSEGKRPVDYLYMQQYALFRGFLLRQQTGEKLFYPLIPSKRIYRERPRDEIEDELERLNPRLLLEDYQ